MSTEGSDTSSTGLRQFGLYRTIDSRTEEFLRLSRKRQMRQGCACAAISTAITVAVVICVILIYEYSIIYEPNSKLNWLNLMNNSVETLPFEAKVNKARIQLDPTYVKFLPLILKTIHKNRFFDKIVEDDSSQNPINEKVDTPDDVYTNNLFPDTRNWMRVPTSRLYTIEYKTSPIIYFKSATRNIDHFTKVRRIRDYQRIMKYVDKMINDRVTLGSTAPMLSHSRSFYKEPQLTAYTTPMTKADNYEKKKQALNKKPKYTPKATPANASKHQCGCPKSMSVLINKLVTSLQKLIPDFTIDEMQNSSFVNKHYDRVFKPKGHMKPKNNPFVTTQPYMNIITKSRIPDITTTEFTSSNSIHQSNIESTSDYFTQNIQSVSTPSNEDQDLFDIEFKNKQTDNTLSSIIKLLTPNRITTTKPYKNNNIMTTMKQSIEGTDAKYILQESTTKPMPKMFKLIKKSTTSTTERNLSIQKNYTKYAIRTTSPNYDDVYEDYIEATTNSFDKYKILDIHSIELLKRKIFTSRNNIKYNQIQITNKPFDDKLYSDIEREYNNKTWNILNQMGKLATYTASNISNYDIALQVNNPATTDIYTEKILESTDKDFTMSKPEAIEQYFDKYKLEQPFESDDVTLKGEIDKATTDLVNNTTTINYAKDFFKTTNKEFTTFKPKYFNKDKSEQQLKSDDLDLEEDIDQDSADMINNPAPTKIYTEKLLENTSKELTQSEPKAIKQNFNRHKSVAPLKLHDKTSDNEIDKAFTEELNSEDNLKSLETILNNLNDSEIFNKSLADESTDLYEWELIKIDDKEDNDFKSMIPDTRSSYLEINRNDWKQDEPPEYDNNINNYFFE